MRTVNLDQLAEAITPTARLMELTLALPARLPNAGFGHPFAQRLLADRNLMTLNQLLAGQCRAEIDVVLTHEIKRRIAEILTVAPVGRTLRSRRDPRKKRPAISQLIAGSKVGRSGR
jgi:hypothetical protein